MQLFFKTITGRTVTVEIERTETFGALREKVSLASGIPQDEMRIIYCGKQLDEKYDNQIIADMDLRHPGDTRSLRLWHEAPIHLVQRRSLDLPHNGVTIDEPKVHWRIRQISNFNPNNNYPLDEKGTISVTVYATLADALEGAKIRQSQNLQNGQTAIIEAVILDNAQLQSKLFKGTSNETDAVVKTPENAKKYGKAFSFIPQGDGDEIKLSTIGYFKQGNARFVTLRKKPMIERVVLSQKPGDNTPARIQEVEQEKSVVEGLNKEILQEVDSAIQNLFTPQPTANVANHGSPAPVLPANYSPNTSSTSRVVPAPAPESVPSVQPNDLNQFFKPDSSDFKDGSLRAKIFEELQDPVDYDLLEDPVILPTGQTLSKKIINRLAPDTQGRKKCPTTNTYFSPNAVRENKLIDQILKLLARTAKESDEVFVQGLEKLLNPLSPQANWENLVEPVVKDDGTTGNKTNSSVGRPYVDYKLKNIIDLLKEEKKNKKAIKPVEERALNSLRPTIDPNHHVGASATRGAGTISPTDAKKEAGVIAKDINNEITRLSKNNSGSKELLDQTQTAVKETLNNTTEDTLRKCLDLAAKPSLGKKLVGLLLAFVGVLAIAAGILLSTAGTAATFGLAAPLSIQAGIGIASGGAVLVGAGAFLFFNDKIQNQKVDSKNPAEQLIKFTI